MTQRLLQIKLRGPVAEDGPVSADAVRSMISNSAGYDRVLLDIETLGGSSNEAFRIYEMVRSLPVPVAAITSKCYSAGVVIFASAALRIARPGAEFLLHPPTITPDKLPPKLTIDSLMATAGSLEGIHDRVIDLMAYRTGFDREWFRNEAANEELLDLAGAIACGLVHSVVGAARGCHPEWPEIAGRIARDEPHIVLPAHLTTSNYNEACRIAAHFEDVLR